MRYLPIVLLMVLCPEAHAQPATRLIPDFATVQCSGTIGHFSAGAGYNVLKSKARFSIHYGIVPKIQETTLNVVSTKFFFKPTTLTIWNRVRMNPVDIGLTASYHFGDNIQRQTPEEAYPRGYYWWYPSLRAHFGMESSVTYEFRKGHSFKSITGYVEFNTNEYYFLSFVQNIKSVHVWDIVKIGTGARLFF